MHVTFTSDPTIPGNVSDQMTLSMATFNFDNLRVIGDAGPSDTRTTATNFSLHWDSMGAPPPIDFSDAPAGVYSKVSFQIDGHLVNSSYHLKGMVNVNGTMTPYTVEDIDALSLSLDVSQTLQPGGSVTVALLVKFHDALTGVDWSMVPFDDGALQLETGNSQMTNFRDKLTQGFSVDTSSPN